MGLHIAVIIAVVFPILCASYAFDKVMEARGPEAFENPGGWRFPIGEVITLGAALAGLCFVGLVGTVL